ncbi:MAG: hypothetical protein Q4B64_07115 [Spirochaetales bacterium]|nr:hypothetical protein [Spirochaetales bacterium]
MLLFSMLMTGQLAAATLKDAEARIQTIETYKLILASGNSDYAFTQEEISRINSMYDELEKDVYTISTRDGSLNMEIGEYDIERTYWPVSFSGSYFEKHVSIEKDITLLYSTLMERRYVAEKDMADYQRRDYEFYVTEYETKIRSGEEVFHAEIHFKIQKWVKPSQYRFVPEELVLYKTAKQERVIDTIKDLPTVIWSYKPEIEYRTKKEIDADYQRTKRILYAESRQAAKNEEDEVISEEDNYTGRRAIYFSLDTFRNKGSDPNSPSISKIELNSFDAALTFGIGNYVFAGLELCFDLNDQTKKTIYSFGGLLGGSIELFKIFRPFIQTGIAFRTDDRLVYKAGAGLDLIIGHMLITGAYNHIWNNSFSSSNEDSTEKKNQSFHSFSIGFGITW